VGEGNARERLAGPWTRCWAKLIDLWLAVAAVFALWRWLERALAPLPTIGPFVAGLGAHNADLVSYAMFFVLVAATFLVDALAQWAFGITPGLALVGARLETASHRRLSLLQALGRNLDVWVYGFWICIGWYPMLINQGVLKRGELVRWDARWGTRVFDVSSGPRRTLAAGACLFALWGVYLWVIDRLGL